MLFRHVEFEETGSTNDVALEYARAGAEEGLVVSARRQISGRGRQGRVWRSPEGNLYVSFLLRPGELSHRAGEISLVAAVAVGRALNQFGVPCQLKWPNDVLVDGAKIAGLLLEKEEDCVVLGVGINVASVPGVVDREVTSLHAEILSPGEPSVSDQVRGGGGIADVLPDVPCVLRCLQEELANWYGCWRESGVAAVRDEWLSMAYGIGSEIRVVIAGGTVVEGVMQGMDERGALMLKTDRGELISCLSGDVFFQ